MLGGPLHAIDDERVDGASRRFELEAQLLLQRREERSGVSLRTAGAVGRPLHLEVIPARQPRAIEDAVGPAEVGPPFVLI